MSNSKEIRVVHVPSSVGGNPEGLSLHLKKLGVHSEVWELSPNPFGYKADKTIWCVNDGKFIREFKRWRAIWRAAREFDIIHLNFGTALSVPFPFRRKIDKGWKVILVFLYALYSRFVLFSELRIYRFYNRKIFIHYQGDDARQGDFCLSHFEHSIAKYTDENYYCKYTDSFKRYMISKFDRYCSEIYAVNPDLLYVLPSRAKYIPYCNIDLDDWVPNESDNNFMIPRPLRIGHAPSHRGAKGTELILDAFLQLRREGFVFEVDLIEGVPHAEARKRYENIDVLIDQLYAGWYGGLSVELMALNKPVMVYIREDDLQFIPQKMKSELPFIQISPDTVLSSVRKVLQMPRDELQKIGKESRKFVERWHDPKEISRHIKSDYDRALRELQD